MHKVLFLDIDGVLNSLKFCLAEGKTNLIDQIDTKAVALLNKITDATGADIVISSSWRIIWEDRFDALIIHLKMFGLTGNIIGATPILSTLRGREIQEWLDEHKDVTEFVILDDDSDMEHLISRLVKTTHENGLQEEHVQACIAKLGTK